MSNLFRTEWLKLKFYKPFWLLFTLYPVCLGGVVAVSLWGQSKVQDAADTAGASEQLSSYLPFAFPTAWQTVTYLGSWLHFIPAVLIILNVTNEFNFRSHRQNLLEGWSRRQFLTAKLVLALGLCLYSSAAVLLFSVIAGAFTATAPTLEGCFYLGLFLLQSSVYAVFALLLAFMIRRAALALAGFLMYSMILENLLAFLLNLKWAGSGGYLPLEAASSLIPLPFLKEHAPDVAKEFLAGPSQTALVAASSVYLIGFAALMWVRFRHEDL